MNPERKLCTISSQEGVFKAVFMAYFSLFLFRFVKHFLLIRLLKSANKKTMSLNRAVHLLFFVSAIIIHHSIHFHHSKSTSVTPWWWEKYDERPPRVSSLVTFLFSARHRELQRDPNPQFGRSCGFLVADLALSDCG